MTIFNLLLLVLVLVFSTESMAVPGRTGGGGSSRTLLYGYGYDELLLVLQWPTSFCNTQKSNCDRRYRILDRFTVHGLWPNENSIGVCCPDPGPGISLPLQLIRLLWRYWPNLQNPKNPGAFWAYEYGKHGYCFEGFGYPVNYFNTALKIAKLIRIDDVMKMTLRSGQVLKEGQIYGVHDFDRVTIAGKTFFPRLRCNKVNSRPNLQLLEIVFCVDKYLNPKTCTFKNTMDCSGQFELPSASRFPPQVPAFSPSDSDSCSAFLPSASRIPPPTR